MSKELEALQDLSKLVFVYGGIKQYQIIEKSLKALEIIKEKEVDIHNLLISETVEQYNSYTHWLGYKGNLTQEEYDLLKEVLKNE